jgi:hypothetical protein
MESMLDSCQIHMLLIRSRQKEDWHQNAHTRLMHLPYQHLLEGYLQADCPDLMYDRLEELESALLQETVNV